MEDQRKNELAVVIAATVVFGFVNRILIRIPYMVLGDFSFSFLISVVTWWIYNSVLFSVAEQMQMGDGGKKRIGKIVLFGFLATLIKAGIDTCIATCSCYGAFYDSLHSRVRLFSIRKGWKKKDKTRGKRDKCFSDDICLFIDLLWWNFILLSETSKLCC